jgi:hypothetical protein
MSAHECIMCGVDPDAWIRYSFFPQEPGSIGGANVICEPCEAGIIEEATRQRCAELAAMYKMPPYVSSDPNDAAAVRQLRERLNLPAVSS